MGITALTWEVQHEAMVHVLCCYKRGTVGDRCFFRLTSTLGCLTHARNLKDRTLQVVQPRRLLDQLTHGVVVALRSHAAAALLAHLESKAMYYLATNRGAVCIGIKYFESG